MILKATSLIEGTKHDFVTFDDYVNEEEHISVEKGYVYVIDKATREISYDYRFRFKGQDRDYGDITFVDKDTREVDFNVCPLLMVDMDKVDLNEILTLKSKIDDISDEFIKAVLEDEDYEGKLDVVVDKPNIKVVNGDFDEDGRLVIPLRDILDDDDNKNE